MPDDPKTKPRPFDLATIRYLSELMSQHDLSEIDLHEGDNRIRLRRGALAPAPAPAAFAHYPAPAGPSPAPGQPAALAAPDKKYHEIRSELVGTFYAQSKPGAEPFVKVGSKVKPETQVGIIEAMKLYNDVLAGCTGTVVEVCVENQSPVEFNSVLFKVDLSS